MKWEHGTVERYWRNCRCAKCAAMKAEAYKVGMRPKLAVGLYRCRCTQLHQAPMEKQCGCGRDVPWA